MNKLALIVSRLSRSAIPVKRFQAEMRTKLKATLDAAVKEAEGGGAEVSALALLKRVREEAYGIFE